MAEKEASLFDFLFKFIPRINLADIGVAECEGLVVDVLLDVHEQFLNVLSHSLLRN